MRSRPDWTWLATKKAPSGDRRRRGERGERTRPGAGERRKRRQRVAAGRGEVGDGARSRRRLRRRRRLCRDGGFDPEVLRSRHRFHHRRHRHRDVHRRQGLLVGHGVSPAPPRCSGKRRRRRDRRLGREHGTVDDDRVRRLQSEDVATALALGIQELVEEERQVRGVERERVAGHDLLEGAMGVDRGREARRRPGRGIAAGKPRARRSGDRRRATPPTACRATAGARSGARSGSRRASRRRRWRRRGRRGEPPGAT